MWSRCSVPWGPSLRTPKAQRYITSIIVLIIVYSPSRTYTTYSLETHQAPVRPIIDGEFPARQKEGGEDAAQTNAIIFPFFTICRGLGINSVQRATASHQNLPLARAFSRLVTSVKELLRQQRPPLLLVSLLIHPFAPRYLLVSSLLFSLVSLPWPSATKATRTKSARK